MNNRLPPPICETRSDQIARLNLDYHFCLAICRMWREEWKRPPTEIFGMIRRTRTTMDMMHATPLERKAIESVWGN